MAKVLRVFDFDDTLATTVSNIYVKHKDGTETTLTPAQYAKYKEKSGWSKEFYDEGHNYPYKLYKQRLETLLKTTKRDLYQKLSQEPSCLSV